MRLLCLFTITGHVSGKGKLAIGRVRLFPLYLLSFETTDL